MSSFAIGFEAYCLAAFGARFIDHSGTLATIACLRAALYAVVAWRLQVSRARNMPRLAIIGL